MLDMIFYAFKTNQPPHYVGMSEDVYEWLAKSEFSKIGKSVPRNILIDEEEEKLPLVELNRDIRQKFRNFSATQSSAKAIPSLLSWVIPLSKKNTKQERTV